MVKAKALLLDMIYYFLILFFAYTAMNKITGFQSFQTNLLKTGFFSKNILPYFAGMVIGMELLVIALLIFYKDKGLKALLVMLLVFTVYISLLNFMGRYEVCGCGGILNGLPFRYHLMINILLIVLTYLLIWKQKKVSNETE